GLNAAADLRTRTLAKIDAAEAEGLSTNSLDDTDLVTIDAMRERLGTAKDLYEAGLKHTVLNVIESPVQQMRDILHMLPRGAAGWETIAKTMAALPNSVEGYRQSLRYARDQLGRVPARLQIERVADQADALGQSDSRFTTIANEASSSTGETLARELTVHAEA